MHSPVTADVKFRHHIQQMQYTLADINIDLCNLITLCHQKLHNNTKFLNLNCLFKYGARVVGCIDLDINLEERQL